MQSFLRSGIPYTEEQCTRYMYILTILIKTSLVNQEFKRRFQIYYFDFTAIPGGQCCWQMGRLVLFLEDYNLDTAQLPNPPTHTMTIRQNWNNFAIPFGFVYIGETSENILIDLYKSVICYNAPNSLITCTMHPLKDKC